MNLFHNLIDVDGMRGLSENLATNKSLRYIDFGFNKLRDEGLKNITMNLSKNQNSKLEVLGLRYNFLSDNAVTSFVDGLNKSHKVKALL